jgi:hypothetical protein
MENKLQQQYAVLCQKLGDLKYKQSQIESALEQVEKELYGLNYVSLLTSAEPKSDV